MVKLERLVGTSVVTLAMVLMTGSGWAQCRRRPDVDVHVGVGARSLAGIVEGVYPMPPAAAAAVDIGRRVRIRADLTYHPVIVAFYGALSGGVVFRPVGREAPYAGGFQIKLVALATVGVVYKSKAYPSLGPALGADFSWWKAGGIGFTLSTQFGLPVFLGSKAYLERESPVDDDTIHMRINPDISLMVAIAF